VIGYERRRLPAKREEVAPAQDLAYQMSASNLEILAYEHTPLGPLCLRRRELLSRPGTVITEVTLNHEFLMSSLYTESETALARLALEMHPGAALRVLVGGLGLGYTAAAALASTRVTEVLVVELLPQVADWLEQDLLPLSAELKADPRFRVEIGDFFARVEEPATLPFDLILVDIDHAPDHHLDHANLPFYSPEGLESVRMHLAPQGVLAVWSSANTEGFSRALEQSFDQVRVEPVTFRNDLVEETVTDWIFLAR
jgi:spermidine synthase